MIWFYVGLAMTAVGFFIVGVAVGVRLANRAILDVLRR